MRKVILAAFAALLLSGGHALAENYPSHPITIVVPFSAGGPTDSMARIMADRMKTTLGQPILIENVTGAGGSIGVGRVARAAPDGYTISIGHLGTHVANGAIYKLNYDLVTDFEPVALLPSNPMVFVTTNSVPVKTLAELLAWLKAKPAPATAGTAGAGSASHVAGLYFESATGIKLQFVPYRGTAPAMTDLVAGQIEMIIDQTSNSISQIRAGTIRAYAVTDEKRLETAAEIPTVDEAGLKGFPHAAVVRPVAAEGHAERHRRKTQRSGSGGHERPGRAREVRESGIADAAEGSTHPGSARHLPEVRDHEMVADAQSRQRQGGIDPGWSEAMILKSP